MLTYIYVETQTTAQTIVQNVMLNVLQLTKTGLLFLFPSEREDDPAAG